MSGKKSRSSRLEAFNRSQEIYKALEKGIIENEALMGSAIDRPEDDAHLSELLESTSEPTVRNATSRKRHVKSRRVKPSKSKGKRRR
ncbi:MAG: hypothetical protein M1569_00940 [Candidatus Marsarchaeota archaeon]|nr:hypothetical protein [Candidatus Marsarchaeota archaeon]MCL5412953.1 hypothetical protein [Candidatus Marsarchaeota archaeon]